MEENIEIPVSYITEIQQAPETQLKSASLLRREYILKKKAEYTESVGKGPSKEVMEDFAEEARNLYPQKGTYEIKGEEVKWLGNY